MPLAIDPSKGSHSHTFSGSISWGGDRKHFTATLPAFSYNPVGTCPFRYFTIFPPLMKASEERFSRLLANIFPFSCVQFGRARMNHPGSESWRGD